MIDEQVVVIGAGISGLTAAALLAKAGVPVTLLEAHHQPGGCAGTFRRGKYLFDVGATQVAGLEDDGIHKRLFSYLQLPLPEAKVLDPACLVDLADGSVPISLWHDPQKWKEERHRQFPGTEGFWELCAALHKSNWAFAGRDPVLPPRNLWDLLELVKAIRLPNLSSGLLSTLTVKDLLSLSGCDQDLRLRKFLDMQLQLYSQQPSDRTAALYGATVLQMAQAPLGLWHLEGSMQKLSDLLIQSLHRDCVQIRFCHRVIGLEHDIQKRSWEVLVRGPSGKLLKMNAKDVVCSLPPQCLLELISSGSHLPKSYRRCLENLPTPSGALVFYGVVSRNMLPDQCPCHYQLALPNFKSLFISISVDGDGRAPVGEATVVASAFTDINSWKFLSETDYQNRKQAVFENILQALSDWFQFAPSEWLHKELSTPRSFARWTGRPDGIVGGLGQYPMRFGLLGLASRTPMNGLWLCGDSIHPGEGTAGVSQSALMACRQLLASRNQRLKI